MDDLFNKRADPKKMQELLTNFYEMGSQIAHHFDIPYAKRADYIQSSVILSWKKLNNFKPKKNRHAFSFFYQVIRRDFMDQMRKEKKRDGIAKMISTDSARNDWIKDIKYFDTQYEVINSKIDKELKLGLRKARKTSTSKIKQQPQSESQTIAAPSPSLLDEAEKV